MAKNTADYDTTIDELADSIVRELADRMSREPPDVDSARIEVSRLLRDSLPALWEWSSQECEIERLRAIVAPIEELTAGGAASVLLYEVAGVEASEKFTVAVNECLPPRFEYFDGATYAEALAKAVEALRCRSPTATAALSITNNQGDER